MAINYVGTRLVFVAEEFVVQSTRAAIKFRNIVFPCMRLVIKAWILLILKQSLISSDFSQEISFSSELFSSWNT